MNISLSLDELKGLS